MRGYKLPVELLHTTVSGMKEYMRERNTPNTGWCFGFEIEFIDEKHVLFHVPSNEVWSLPRHEDGKIWVEDLAQKVNEASGIDFSYTKKEWIDIVNAGSIEVTNTSYYSIPLKV